MAKRVIIDFYDLKSNQHIDIEVPLNITANELYQALASVFQMKKNPNQFSTGFLKSENPIALLKGNRTLEEYGLRDGSRILFS